MAKPLARSVALFLVLVLSGREPLWAYALLYEAPRASGNTSAGLVHSDALVEPTWISRQIPRSASALAKIAARERSVQAFSFVDQVTKAWAYLSSSEVRVSAQKKRLIQQLEREYTKKRSISGPNYWALRATLESEDKTFSHWMDLLAVHGFFSVSGTFFAWWFWALVLHFSRLWAAPWMFHVSADMLRVAVPYAMAHSILVFIVGWRLLIRRSLLIVMSLASAPSAFLGLAVIAYAWHHSEGLFSRYLMGFRGRWLDPKATSVAMKPPVPDVSPDLSDDEWRRAEKIFHEELSKVYNTTDPSPTEAGIFKTIPWTLLIRRLRELHVGPGSRLVDLGSGDGRVVIAAAFMGATAIGFEADPKLVIASQRIQKRLEQELLWNLSQATLVKGDFFDPHVRHHRLSEATIVFYYWTGSLPSSDSDGSLNGNEKVVRLLRRELRDDAMAWIYGFVPAGRTPFYGWTQSVSLADEPMIVREPDFVFQRQPALGLFPRLLRKIDSMIRRHSFRGLLVQRQDLNQKALQTAS